MPEPTVWYEVGTWAPKIYRRLIAGETTCYVFHPNGQKSLKGTTWFKTFDAAKQALLTQHQHRIESLKQSLIFEEGELTKIQQLTEESCQEHK